jgi:hypothetical protein
MAEPARTPSDRRSIRHPGPFPHPPSPQDPPTILLTVAGLSPQMAAIPKVSEHVTVEK